MVAVGFGIYFALLLRPKCSKRWLGHRERSVSRFLALGLAGSLRIALLMFYASAGQFRLHWQKINGHLHKIYLFFAALLRPFLKLFKANKMIQFNPIMCVMLKKSFKK